MMLTAGTKESELLVIPVNDLGLKRS
jgi:hypothetical protein